MREEWNKGYEKGRDDYCCNHNCNQGRDCPLRKVEPVAWMEKVKGGTIYFGYKNPRSIPLYTHPVKELTDEEICKIFNEHTGLGIHQKEADKADLIVFARAIMKRCGIISGTDK